MKCERITTTYESNGAMIKSGAGGASSIAFAKAMVELYAPEFNQ